MIEIGDNPSNVMDKQLAKLWFLENYEQSRAPNMSIYKRDLFNKFTSTTIVISGEFGIIYFSTGSFRKRKKTRPVPVKQQQ